MDRLVPGRPLLNIHRDTAPEVEAHRGGRTPGGRATEDHGNAGQAHHTDKSNFAAAVRSLAANHNRARRNPKPAGSLPVAQHSSREELALEGLALECHRGKPQPAGAELGRRGTAGKPPGLER